MAVFRIVQPGSQLWVQSPLDSQDERSREQRDESSSDPAGLPGPGSNTGELRKHEIIKLD